MDPYRARYRSATPHKILKNERGAVLAVLMSFMLVFAVSAAGMTQYASNSMRLSRSQEAQVRALYMAESATERVLAAVKNYVSTNGTVPGNLNTITSAPGTGSLFTLSNFNISSTASTYQTLTSGDYAGLNANVQTVTVTARAQASGGTSVAPVNITQTFEIQHIPVFQFGVFYQNDLEIGPGVNMTITGPVHTNSDLYVTADNGVSVTFNSKVTSAGGIKHALKEGGSETGVQGNVFIRDSGGTNQNMKNADSTWLDTNHADWLLTSQSRWGGNVQSQVHGVSALNLPLQAGSTPHDIIERRSVSDSTQLQSQKFDYKAHLRIIDGVVMNQAGSTVELRYCSGGGTYNSSTNSCPGSQTVVNPIATASFTDNREQKTMRVTEVDIAKLNSSPNFASIVSANNGVIIYGSDQRYSGTNEGAFRLVNGSTLPTNGLTFASENPVYIKGNYNTTSKKPAGIVADAFNVLSGNWSDSNAATTSARQAVNTTINTAVIAGNTSTVSGQYNGGLENGIRLSESWSGDTLTYSGSIAILYLSEMATGQWGKSQVYSPPTRNWSYDTSFSGTNYNIPGFPSIINVVRTSYEQT